jgi:hypothetical protein
MAWTVQQPERRRWHRRQASAMPVEAYRPLGVTWLGVLVLLVSAWAGVVAFVGPSFNYPATATTAWQWTTTNWLLHLVPGAVGVLAALIIVALAPSSTAGARTMFRLAALAVIAAGAWLVIGPAVWKVFESSSAYAPASTAQISFGHQAGANLGPGLALAMFGGMILESAGARRLGLRPDVPATETAPVADRANGTESVPAERQ